MFVSCLCSSIEFPGNDPVLVTSKQELARLQRAGSAFNSHYYKLTSEALAVAQASHCNLFESFPSQMVPMFTQVMDHCLKATHIVPESGHIQTLRSTMQPKASRVAVEGPKKITRGLKGWVGASQDASRPKFGLCDQKNSVGTNLFGTPPLKQVQGRWYEQVNSELMGLLMTASWLFYPTLAPANALQCASKYTKELYAEGDVMMSELGKDDDPGICIPACKNRLSGNWEMGHVMLLELVVLPLYDVLEDRLGINGNLAQAIRQIKEFHASLKKILSDRTAKHVERLERSESALSEQSFVESQPMSSKQQQHRDGSKQGQQAVSLPAGMVLPDIRPASRLGEIGVTSSGSITQGW